MLSKNQKKYVISLYQKKFRQKYNKFIAQGLKICYEILISDKIAVENLFATPNFIETHEALINEKGINAIEVSEKELKSISTLKNPNQVIMVCECSLIHPASTRLKGFSFYLDRIQEPGNMGTILRIADWFGIENVFLSKGCVDLYNEKVIQSSMGSFLRTRISQIEVNDLIEYSKQISLLSTSLKGENIYELKTPKEGIIVLGNESKGIQESILNASDFKIFIPRIGQAESLNVAVAAGIITATLTVAS